MTKKGSSKKRKKFDVPAGKSVSTKLFDESSADDMDLEGVPTSTPKPKRGCPRRNRTPETESEHASSYSLHDCSRSDDGSNFYESESEDFGEDVGTSGPSKEDLPEPEYLKSNLEEGDFLS